MAQRRSRVWHCGLLALLLQIVPASDLVAQDDKSPAAKASGVLAAHCARCHQANRLGGRVPAGNLGNILELDEIANDPALIRRQLPDGSALYARMLHRHRPLAVYEGTPNGGPSPQDVAAVRDWIEGLDAVPSRCAGRALIAPRETAADMQRWLKRVGAGAAKETRFVTLAPFHNACASDREMAAYRQAVEKVLNSLSRSAMPARIHTVGDGLALLAFNLTDLGWEAGDWERLASAHPKGSAPVLPKEMERTTASALPVLRADWLAYEAMRPPLYYDVLEIPAAFKDLASQLGLDPTAGGGAAKLARASVRQSAVTGGPRLLERHAIRDGFLWLAHDLPPGSELPDDGDPPSALVAPNGAKAGPRPLARRLLYSLPNGFLAAAIENAEGGRIDSITMGREPLAGLTARPLSAGAPCMACHADGPLTAKDEARQNGDTDKSSIQKEHLPAAELARQFDSDIDRFRGALTRAGIDPDLRLHGLEIVTALARRYDRDVNLTHAAAELGIEASDLARRLEGIEGDARPLALRLAQGLLGRADLERLFLALRQPEGRLSLASADRLPPGDEVTPSGGTFDLALWSERSAYKVGDLASFHVKADADCFLTLIDVDSAGRATVLFPNDLEPANLVKAGQSLRIPGATAGYQLRFNEKGGETLIATCSSNAKAPPGVDHDFERQRFTLLGDWRKFLITALAPGREARRAPEKVRRIRNRRMRVRKRTEPKPEVRPGPEVLARAVITIRVD